MGLFGGKHWEYSVVIGDEVVLTTESKEEANRKVQELQFAGKHHVHIDRHEKDAAAATS